jgi:hypothetical protein
VVLTALDIAFAAAMFERWASRPRLRSTLSLRMMIGCPPSIVFSSDVVKDGIELLYKQIYM